MTPYSPLEVGQIIYPSEAAKDKVWPLISINEKENLAKGLLCEYAHNDAFDAAGWKYQLTDTVNSHDRIYNGLKQDDKLATLTNGTLSKSHSISALELLHWSRSLDDVIIHSFEEIDDGKNGSRYMGAISFHRLLESDMIQPSTKKPGTYYFYRKDALRDAVINLETGSITSNK